MMNQVSWLSRRDLFSFSLFFWCHFFQLLAIPFVRSFVHCRRSPYRYIHTIAILSFVRSFVEAKPCLISLASSLFPLASAFQFGPFVQSDETNYRPIENADGRGCVFHFDFVYILGLILHVIHTVYIISFVDLFNPPEKGFFFLCRSFFFRFPRVVFFFLSFSHFSSKRKK